MDDEYPPTERAPDYQYDAQVENVVDGDTVDVRIDLGFETYIIERLRIRGIDTREIHFVFSDSEEYERGMVHKEYTEAFVNDTGEYEWPFVLWSEEFDRGTYGRVIGDIYSRQREEWLAPALLEEFDDVETYDG